MVHFHLKDSKASDLISIQLIYWFNNKRIKFYTNEKINPIYWDIKAQRAIESDEFPRGKKINKNLNRYEEFLDNLIELAKYNKIPLTSDSIKKSLEKEFKAHIKEKETPSIPKMKLMDFIDLFIKECKSGKRLTPKGKIYKDWTMKGFTTLILHLNGYQDYYKRKIDFEDITLEFYKDFLKYFNDHKKRVNTIGKHVKNLKTIMSAATDDGYNTNMDFRNKKFKVLTEETDKIYLTEEELLKIYNLDLSENKRLDNVRDLFLIAAFTALRFGDMEKLKGDHFVFTDKMNYLKIMTQKTDINVIIPLKEIVIKIYNKYDGNLPRCLSNQKMNDYLKEIGEAAKILGTVNVSTTKGGMRFDESFQKWELITTHTARRSAATNMYLAEVPTISIMKLTGHKTEKAFLRYIRISQEDNAVKLMEHPYFRNQNMKIVS